MSGDKIRCPCSKCKNLKFKHPDEVGWDLYADGFLPNYYNWNSHGEPLDPSVLSQTVGSSRNVPAEMSAWGDTAEMRWEQRMVYDAYGASMSQFNPPQPSNDPPEASTSYQPHEDENPIFYEPYVDEGLAERFQDILKAADQPLYADCEGYSQLSTVTEFMNIKAEYSLLFQSICSSVLDAASFRRLEESVPMLMCNLEKIMPPSFCDGMEHLVIHLPYEALNGGPVFYRWMYRFERLVTISFIFEYLFHNNINLCTTFILLCRFLGELKKKMTNKAHVEASICQAYLQQGTRRGFI
ncbi:unnamed protein product [Cuscuta europaea]|uniref:Transposase-associated domain-containing protein n=1 Tax=Cuscuta europaea TaxID=41803 RepID=A0A9P1EFH8_CUSEU|nr:unnamed protein product [Cuscuta europaea]